LANLVQVKGINGELDMLNNNMKTPYSDQFSLGMRNTVGQWNTSAAIAYIHSMDGFAFTLGNRHADGSWWNANGQAWGEAPPGFGALILGNNGIETKTTQLLLSADKPYTKESGWSVSVAYTFSHAIGNRGGDEHYSFDAPWIQDYPFISLASVPKHRLVMTGIYDLPWGITASAKLTLSTPPPINAAINRDAYGGSLSDGMPLVLAVSAPGTLGVRQLDLSLSKDMHVTEHVTVQVRGDLINAFNASNLSGYNILWGNGGVLNPQVSTQPYGSQFTPPRTLFLSARVMF
jgi:hypothetical protein